MARWPAFLTQLVHENPTAIALADASGDISRRDLHNRIALWSSLLVRRGVLPGDRILLALPPGLDAWVALLAALGAGATVIPMEAEAADLRRMVRAWRPSVCITSGMAQSTTEEAGIDQEQRIDIESLPRKSPRQRENGSPRHNMGHGEAEPFRFASRGQILLVGGHASFTEPGCLHGIEGVFANARRLFQALTLDPDLSGLVTTSPAHWAGLVFGLGLLDLGRPAWLASSQNAECLLQLIEEAGPLACFSTLEQWRRLLGTAGKRACLLPIRHLVTTSGMASAEQFRQTRSLPMAPRVDLVYGTARALALTRLSLGVGPPLPGCIGHPLPGVTVQVMRRPDREARPGQPGYLVHDGASCLLFLPGKAEKDFAPEEPQLDHGDIGWRDAEGCLFRLPSPKDLIRTGGRVLVPETLEQQVLDSGLVDEAYAFGVPHPHLQEAVVLVAVARPRVTPHQLRRFCRESMPDFMVPHRIELHPSLPAAALARSGRDFLRLRYAGLYR